MKGFFKTPHNEFNITVQGETWQQGSLVRFSVDKSDNNDQHDTLTIAHADIKKLAKGDAKAFDIILQKDLSQASSRFDIPLKVTCPIKDTQKSTFILLGSKDNLCANDRLELPIIPRQIYKEIIGVLELYYRFKLKTLKNKNDSLDAKFSIPASKEYAGFEAFNLHFKTVDQSDDVNPKGERTLNLEFHFKVKKLTYKPEGVVTVTEKVTTTLELKEKDLFIYGDSFNQDKVKQELDKVLSLAKVKF